MMAARVLACACLLVSGGAVRNDLKMDTILSFLQSRAHSGHSARVQSQIKMLGRVLDQSRDSPEAMQNYDSVLSQTISTLETTVESSIKEDFGSTQQELNDRIAKYTDTTQQAEDAWRKAKGDDSEWVQCVSTEQQALMDVEQARADLARAQEQDAAALAKRDALAPFSSTKEVVPVVSCDLSIADSCAESTQAMLATYTDGISAIGDELDEQQTQYQEADAAYKATSADVASKTTTLAEKESAYDKQVNSCMTLQGEANVAMCDAGEQIQGACAAGDSYTDLVQDTQQAGGSMYSEIDRQAEWDTVAVVKCLLQAAMDDVAVDSAALDSCESNVNYAGDVGVLDTKQSEYEAIDPGYGYNCSPGETITFSGKTWAVPLERSVAQSSDYVESDYSPVVSLTGWPFDFCAPVTTLD